MRDVLFILVYCAIPLNAQLAVQWQTALGGANADQPRHIFATMDGGFIVVGTTLSNDGDVFGNHGSTDFWVVKLTFDGKVQWKRAFGGSDVDRPFTVFETTDNGYIVAGATYSNDGDVSGNHGDVDAWVIKLDLNGNLQWSKCIGGTKRDEFWNGALTKDGNFILVGMSGSEDGDVTKNRGAYDLWVVKIDQNGSILWQRTMGGSNYEFAYSIIPTFDGGYIVAGESSSIDVDVSGNHGEQPDYWIVKLNFDGKIEWEKSYGGSGIEDARDILQTEDGGYIVTGQASSSDGDITSPKGGFDFWTIKLSDSGAIEWQKSIGGNGQDNVFSIGQLTNEAFMLFGSTDSTNGDILDNNGGTDFLLVSISKTGAFNWEKTYGGTQAEVGYCAKVLADSSIVMTGYSFSNNGDVTTNHGKTDFWVVKLSPTNTPTLTPPLTQLSLYPNPTDQQLTLQIPDNEPITSIQIIDLSGKTLKTEQAPQDQNLQVAMLPKGMYLLKAHSASGKVFCGKFIKE